MKDYDVIVIGTGCGMIIADEAVSHGLKVAVVDKGPLLGGTCLNLGCIPSKMLIYPADRLVELQESGKLGIEAEVKGVDFKSIMGRMRKSRAASQRHMRQGIARSRDMDFYGGVGHFVDDYTIEVDGKRLKGGKIFLASGSRPLVPPVKGLEGIDYLTSETLLELEEKPESLIIIGGGYIGVEYGHFFAAMGTRVTILEMADGLVLAEEPEISALLRQALGRRMRIYTGAVAEEVKKKGGGVSVAVQDRKTGARREVTAERLLMAVGRGSNADWLKLENAGVKTDKRGFIQVNARLETSRKNIFAVGDANGQQMFTHMANREAMLAAHNALHDARSRIDYSAAPHAVYSHPQIAAAGLTEAAARQQHQVLVGRAHYADTAKGEAMLEGEGFAKAVVEKDSGRILGFHIIGPYAPELIQEVVNAMASGGHINELNRGIHIHPALSELVPLTFANLEEG